MRSSLTRSRAVKPAAFIFALSLACATPQLLAKKKLAAPGTGANEQKRAVHALNRLAFGPRPGDLQQVIAMGVDQWIELQLHPEKISDTALDARLAQFRTLRMSSRQMVDEFPDNQIIKQVMDGKRSMPSDPAERAVYEVQVARLEDRLEEKLEEKKQQGKSSRNTEAAPYAPASMAAPSSSPEPRSTEQAAMSAPANDTAKTAEELAAAASASSDALPATPADANLASPAGASNAMPANGMSMPASTGNASTDAAPAEMKSTEAKSTPANDPEAHLREENLYADLKVQSLIDLPPGERYRKVMAMPVDEKLAFVDSMRGGKADAFLAGMDPKQKETMMALKNPQAVVVDELVQAKLLRAIYSERQLEEVMTDFWLNHFNVFINKGADRVLLTNYEQDVIRPHALGRFEDLLVATAKSPAMLFYLDNWMSVGPNSMEALGIRPGAYGRYRRYPVPYPGSRNANQRRRNGLNENYGRELLELHTLSVNGGYTQHDVTEVAKVFTGWTIDKPAQGGDFKYEPRMHEPGPKFVLGKKIKPNGEDEGKEVLHMLATSPKTAHFICLKLAERFVSDDPPPALVDRMAKTFLKKKGDIREVLTTLFHSPEFWDDSAYRAKVKTPLEFVASAVRATGADVEDAMPLARQIANMGMPLYGAQPPTGYSMNAETWVSSSALLSRMNFALAFAAGKVRGVKVDAVQLAGGSPAPADPTLALSTLEAKLLDADVSRQTHDSIMAQIGPPAKNPVSDMSGTQDQKNQRKPADKPRPSDANIIAGLLLGSPEFQRR
ncbi:MAG TPA: DUF1800 family protein [Terriglobales bacterium]|nr:DUF1800 family protein [Terriglobales bacterium]